MKAYNILLKKKQGQSLTKDEIEFFVNGFTDGSIPDYQMSALLMAICINGMTDEETYNLTMAMRDSGDIIDLNDVEGIKVDKHSTGGVGDKVTLILSPMLASMGVKVAKMSGKGLGHTGGTIDKLESIKGFNTALSKEEFIGSVNDIGIAIAGQTGNLAPADKKIYALRDVTATVDCIPLIASSIMSKKLAAGADAIVLDVKCGNGAFMKNEEDAKKLATNMISIGKMAGKETTAIITDMNQPLGHNVGNGLEIIEVIECLKGNGPSDLMEVVYALGSKMVVLANKADDCETARKMLEDSISSSKAYDKFVEFVKNQNGDISYIEDTSKLCNVKIVRNLSLNKEGYINSFDTENIGRAVGVLGGGRETKESIIDYTVGIIVNKKLGEYVDIDDAVFTIFANDENRLNKAIEILEKSVIIKNINNTKTKIIKTII